MILVLIVLFSFVRFFLWYIDSADYGKSYYDVVKSVEHVVENFKSDQISEPSNFKYWIALEKQVSLRNFHELLLLLSYVVKPLIVKVAK